MVKPPPRLVNPYVPDLKLLRSWPSSSSAHDDDGHVLLQERTADDEEGQQQQQQQQQQPQHNRGRSSNDELRPIRLQTSLSSSESESVSASAAQHHGGSTSNTSSNTSTISTTTGGGGWAKVSMGSTTVLCHVHAPIPISSLYSSSGATATSYYDGTSSNGIDDDNTIMDTGILAIHVHLAPHLQASASTSTSTLTRQFERSLERQVHQALLPSVPLRQYAKCAILVEITVVSTGASGGSGLMYGSSSSSSALSSRLLVPAVLASTLALMDAHVELYDMGTCGRIALVVGSSKDEQKQQIEMVVDPDAHDEERAMMVLTIATLCSWKEITYWNQQQQSNNTFAEELRVLDPALVNDAVECCLNMCKTIRKLAVRHLHAMHVHRHQPPSG